jgi:hypothetical protein
MKLEDKLKKLDRFDSTRPKAVITAKNTDRLLQLLDGTMAQNEFGEFVLARKKFDQNNLYREIRFPGFQINGELLARICLSPRSRTKETCHTSFDLKVAVFVDCETTGLAGGAGTYAFLIGLGYLDGEDFWVEQYFMQDFHQERAVLSAVAERLNRFKFLVSFNGKCYDLPLLENRFVINRLDFDTNQWTHLDLLFPSRRLWKRRIGECSLNNIEGQILDIKRDIDVPSYMVPQIYFDYLRTGESEPLIPVFHHNLHDIVSLLKLSVLIDQTLEDFSQADIEDSMDLYSLGRIHQNLGNYQTSVRCFKQALSEELSPEWHMQISMGLAFIHKKMGDLEEAANIWQNLTEGDSPFYFYAHEELAKFYEHKRKDHLKALSLVEEAIFKLSSDLSSSFTSVCQTRLDSLRYRKSRLERKIKKAKDGV